MNGPGLRTTPAVVLRTTAFGDTSQVVQVLTRDHGRIGLMARGARKKPGALAPFQSGTLTYRNKPGRDLQSFREFAVARSRLGVARGMSRFNGAALMVELVLRTSGEDASGGSFDALEGALDAMERVPDDDVWVQVFTGAWSIVRTLGYAPELDMCGKCGRRPVAAEMMRFNMKEGVVTCTDCSAPTSPRLGPGARDQLSRFLNADAGLTAADLEAEHRRPHLVLLGDFVTYHITGDPPLKSLTGLMGLLT